MTAPTDLTAPAVPADLRDDRQPLDAIFNPTSVAVIGATEKEGSVGRTILWNLLSSPFGGTVYPVNPTRPAILWTIWRRCFSSLKTTSDRTIRPLRST